VEGSVVDILPTGEYDEEMRDALGKRATTVKGLDITGCFPDAQYTVELYCGVTEDNVTVVQLAEERSKDSKRKSIIVPLSEFGELPPDSITKFIAPSSWLKPADVAKIVREHAR
jgi:hypothetical protein